MMRADCPECQEEAEIPEGLLHWHSFILRYICGACRVRECELAVRIYPAISVTIPDLKKFPCMMNWGPPAWRKKE